MKHHSGYQAIKASGQITVVPYEEFVADISEEMIYTQYFRQFYYHIHKKELNIPEGRTVRTLHCAKNSFGEIHSAIMAMNMRLPVFLSDDRGAKTMICEKVNSSRYALQVYNIPETMGKLAQIQGGTLKRKELILILNGTGHGKMKDNVLERWVD